MVTQALFDTGLRLDQYIATIALNKENFRANFIKAIEAYSAEDIVFFRSLPEKVNVVVITDDDNPDGLRDVPLIGRISVEVGRINLRVFRLSTHQAESDAFVAEIGMDKAERSQLPVIAWFSSDMNLLGAHIRRLPQLHDDMVQRQLDWVQAHPEVKDAGLPIEKMTPVTRTRITQAVFALTPEQRLAWGKKTVLAWRTILDGLTASKKNDEQSVTPRAPAAPGLPADAQPKAPSAPAERAPARRINSAAPAKPDRS